MRKIPPFNEETLHEWLDQKSISLLSEIHPIVRQQALNVLYDMRFEIKKPMRVLEAQRTFQKQKALYDQGRNKPGKIVTNARPGESFHNYGVALDCCFVGLDPFLEKIRPEDSMKYWRQFGLISKAHGFKWGGDFKNFDGPHIEMNFGLSIHKMKIVHEEKGLQAVWKLFHESLV